MIHARRARNRRTCIRRFRPISITSFFKEVTGHLYVTVTLFGPFPDIFSIAQQKNLSIFPYCLQNPAGCGMMNTIKKPET